MEFDLIAKYFKPLAFTLELNSSTTRSGCSPLNPPLIVDLAPNDDGAVLDIPADKQLVVVTDTLVSGVHFFPSAEPFDLGWKSLAVNLSDLAAMGAVPAFYSLAISLPKNYANQAWLQGFVEGLAALAKPLNLPLIGGDTTKSEVLTITITAQGLVDKNRAIKRSGAKVGDDIFVSGFIGDAGCALASLLAEEGLNKKPASEEVLAKFHRPEPRLALGLSLQQQNLATSAIDVSDGLLADLNHILQASKVGAKLDSALIPIRQEVKIWAIDSSDNTVNQYLTALTAGEDFELCFTADKSNREKITQLAKDLDLKISRIGEIIDISAGFELDNQPLIKPNSQQKLGFLHF